MVNKNLPLTVGWLSFLCVKPTIKLDADLHNVYKDPDQKHTKGFISNRKLSRNLPNTDVRELQYRYALTSEAPSSSISSSP